MTLTPWDVQSKRIYTTDGTAPPLCAGGSTRTGLETYILIEETEDDSESVGRTEQAHTHR